MSSAFTSRTANRLNGIVSREMSWLQAIDEEKATQSFDGDSWSAKEVIGHLIDSACNNHRRFVKGIKLDHLEFDGYNQEFWVRTQDYQSLSWLFLLQLWRDYNVLLAHVIAALPEEKVLEMRSRHSFDKMAYKTIPKSQSSNLAYLIEDYIDHLLHHLKQIESLTASAKS